MICQQLVSIHFTGEPVFIPGNGKYISFLEEWSADGYDF